MHLTNLLPLLYLVAAASSLPTRPIRCQGGSQITPAPYSTPNAMATPEGTNHGPAPTSSPNSDIQGTKSPGSSIYVPPTSVNSPVPTPSLQPVYTRRDITAPPPNDSFGRM